MSQAYKSPGGLVVATIEVPGPSRWQRVMADPDTPDCLTDGCTRKAWSKGLCSACFRLVRKYGVAKSEWHDPEQIRRRRIQFLWDNIDVRGPYECWPWKRKLPATTGYGSLHWFDRHIGAHVAVYELVYGATPPETPVHDHICHDPAVCQLGGKCPHRACCNPAHIKACTQAENRSEGRSVQTRTGNGGGKKCEPGCTCKRHFRAPRVNAVSTRVRRNNTSGFKGVARRRGRWQAYISVGGQRIHLGYFGAPEDAADAYDKAAVHHFGEAAITNAMLGQVASEGARQSLPFAKGKPCPPGCTCGRHRRAA